MTDMEDVDVLLDDVVQLIGAKLESVKQEITHLVEERLALVEERLAQFKKEREAKAGPSKDQQDQKRGPRPRMDVNSQFKRMINLRNKSVEDLPSCCICAASVKCYDRKSKFREKNSNVSAILAAFRESADMINNTGTISFELRPFWLCGNHVRQNISIDYVRLAKDYIEFCEKVPNQRVDKLVYEKLQKAQNRHDEISDKRRKRANMHNEEQAQADDQQATNSNNSTELKRRAVQQSTGKHHDHDHVHDHDPVQEKQPILNPEKVDDEEVQPTSSEVMAIFPLQQEAFLKKLKITNCEAIYNARCPVPETQVITYDDARKMCVVTELQMDKAQVPLLYCGFYGEKFTGVRDATPKDERTCWLPCVVETFLKAGANATQADMVVKRLRGLANKVLDIKYRDQ